MDSLLNKNRPPAFCPGCAHGMITNALDQTFQGMNLKGNEVAIVTDIGCSGLFDTFFNTHAFHGLHGRALTYATGIKLAMPELHVIVTMGDGGLGIGGAHLLSACRRNIDITLLILNNFNYGMTGGQCSSTTPQDAQVGSGFLNQIEKPIDACTIIRAAGGTHVTRASAYDKTLPLKIEEALAFKGFSAMDIWGVCPGRYTKKNKITPKSIQAALADLPVFDGPVKENLRDDYWKQYHANAVKQPIPSPPHQVSRKFSSICDTRQEIVILGSAGQRIVTAGEIVCYAGLTAGLEVTQKNDYPITVLRGHSVSELILSPEPVDFTGIDTPNIILALAQEGVDRKKDLFLKVSEKTVVLSGNDVTLPDCAGKIINIDFKQRKIGNQNRALAALAILSHLSLVITPDMLHEALRVRFKGKAYDAAMELVRSAQYWSDGVLA
jgi:2-oxoglutarate ferredoxin oxidoreductase subunit beta